MQIKSQDIRARNQDKKAKLSLFDSIHIIEITLNSAAGVNTFIIEKEDLNDKNLNILISTTDPFDEFISDDVKYDRRVSIVKNVLNSLKKEDNQQYFDDLYGRINHLWEEVEIVNNFTTNSHYIVLILLCYGY